MPNNKIPKKDIAILLKLNLFDFFDQTSLTDERKQKFLETCTKLTWVYFFDQEGKELSDEEKKNIYKLFEEKKYKEAEELLIKKFEHFKEILLKNSLLAKKVVILKILENKIVKEKTKARIEKKKDSSDRFVTLMDHAYHDKWEDFISILQSVK